MEAILYKTIPIYFNRKTNKLYFDEIEKFDSSSFKFLKVSKTPMTTHFICFNEIGKIDDNSKLYLLVLELKRMVDSQEIKFGIPLGIPTIDSGSNNKIKHIDRDDKGGHANIRFISPDKPTGEISGESGFFLNGTVSMIDVGQGLCFVDNKSGVIYDAGGSKRASSVRFNLSDRDFILVISHGHHDHYKYVKYLIENNDIRILFIPERTIETVSWKKILKIARSKGTKILFHKDFKTRKGYESFVFSGASSINADSILLKSDEWILTGDQETEKIMSKIAEININNFQIPHHLSGATEQDPDNMVINKIKKAHFCSLGVYRGMPSKIYKEKYESKGAKVVSTTGYKIYK